MKREVLSTEHTMLCRSGIAPCHEESNEADLATHHRHHRHRVRLGVGPVGPVRLDWGHAIAFTIVVTVLWVAGIVLLGG